MKTAFIIQIGHNQSYVWARNYDEEINLFRFHAFV